MKRRVWLSDAICDRTDGRFYHPSIYHSLFYAWGVSADISQTPCGEVSCQSHGRADTLVHRCTCALLTLLTCSFFRLYMESENKMHPEGQEASSSPSCTRRPFQHCSSLRVAFSPGDHCFTAPHRHVFTASRMMPDFHSIFAAS